MDEAHQRGRRFREGRAAARGGLDVPAQRRMVRPARRPEDALDPARIPAEGPDQRPAAAVVALDGRALLRADRDQGSGAQRGQGRQGRMGARLSIPERVRRGSEAVGFQAADQLGRRARPLAGARTSQHRNGGHVPGGVPQVPQGSPQERVMSSERLWAALAEVQDPEMPVNLVDLGVIYGIDEHDGVVEVALTFTAMGCPASDFILEDVRERLLREDGVREVRVKVVWDPPWTSARMTQAGRDALEAWGLAV